MVPDSTRGGVRWWRWSIGPSTWVEIIMKIWWALYRRYIILLFNVYQQEEETLDLDDDDDYGDTVADQLQFDEEVQYLRHFCTGLLLV